MSREEVKFKDLSFKDKILSVLMTIFLVIVYTLMLIMFLIFVPIRIYWCIAILFLRLDRR